MRSMPIQSLMSLSGSCHPGGMVDNSPAFQRRDSGERASSPEGTAESDCLSRPSGPYPSRTSKPGVETPGYSQASLRDDDDEKQAASAVQLCAVLLRFTVHVSRVT